MKTRGAGQVKKQPQDPAFSSGRRAGGFSGDLPGIFPPACRYEDLVEAGAAP